MATGNTTLNPVSNHIKEGISLFTACRNRNDYLERALQTWLRYDEVDEIIVLDWSSDESLKPLIDKYQNGKIILAEASGQRRWILSHAYNLAARLTTRTRIFKIDTDVEITGDFFQLHKLSRGHFFSGNWRKARNLNERHLNGMIYLLRVDFFKVNGYNEFIKTYGWDDCNLYERLETLGLVKKDIDLDTLRHIEHENRVVKEPADGSLSYSDDTDALLNILTNKEACGHFPHWHMKEMMEFDVRAIGENHFSCIQRRGDENVAAEEIMSEAKKVALKTVLSWGSRYCPPIPQDMTVNAGNDELYKLYDIMNAPPPKKDNRNGFVLVTSARNVEDISGLLEKLNFFHTHYNHAEVSEIHVFYTGHHSDVLFGYLNGKDHVKIFMSDAEPPLEDLRHYASRHFVGRKVIISNTTIDFNDILERLACIDFDNRQFNLVRWIVPESNSTAAPAGSRVTRLAKWLLGILRKKRGLKEIVSEERHKQ